MKDGNRVNLFYVYKVLERYSDRDHFLLQTDICKLIEKDFSVTLDRKSVGRIIDTLVSLDIDIQRGPSKGFALIGRLFEESEVRFLTDAVFSSKAVPGKIAQDLATRISGTLSVYQRKDYDYLLKCGDVIRTENKQVFYNIEIIAEAIKNNKWIAYQYMTYNKEGELIPRFDGYIYHASPCYLINNSGNYYLLAFRRGRNKVVTWRVDYMREISIMEDRERLDPLALDEFKGYRDISEYINDHIYMFGGEVVSALLELKNESVISYIKDWFGNSAEIFNKDDKLFAKVRCDENALYYWVMQYSDHVSVVYPEALITRIVNAANSLIDKYKDSCTKDGT